MLLDNRIYISPSPPFFSLTKSLPRDRRPCRAAPTCSGWHSCLQKSSWCYWTILCSFAGTLIFFPFRGRLFGREELTSITALNLFQFLLPCIDFVPPSLLSPSTGACSPQTFTGMSSLLKPTAIQTEKNKEGWGTWFFHPSPLTSWQVARMHG